MARRSKYNLEVVEMIAEAVAKGATYEMAARYAGVAQSTFYEWMKTKPEIAEALKRAEGRGVVACLDRIQTAATDGNWQAAAWILERRYPDDYGRRERQDVHHSGAVKSIVEYSNDWKTPTVQLPAGRVVESEPA